MKAYLPLDNDISLNRPCKGLLAHPSSHLFPLVLNFVNASSSVPLATHEFAQYIPLARLALVALVLATGTVAGVRRLPLQHAEAEILHHVNACSQKALNSRAPSQCTARRHAQPQHPPPALRLY